MLIDAEPDLTAFAALPANTGPRSDRSNPIERLNRETRRRADVAPGPPRQRVRTPPDRLRPARATRSGSTANADLSQTSLRRLTDMLHTDNSTAPPAITT